MEELLKHFSKITDQAGLETHTKDIIFHILKDEEMLNYKGLRLIWLLRNLKSGRFKTLSTVEKKEDLEIFFYLLRYKNANRISEICHLFFEGDLQRQRRDYFLPQEMIKGLLAGGKEDKNEVIKEIIWDFLLSEEKGLREFITPNELMCGLWFENPIVRNKIILFLLRHFAPEVILSTLASYMIKTGKKLPANSFNMLMKLAKTQTDNVQRNHFIKETLNYFQLPDKGVNGILSDYLKGLGRFDLIKILSLNNIKPNWIENSRKLDVQLSFDFKPQGIISRANNSFFSRVVAIKKQEV
jgi:hypothetical protein